MDEEMKFTITDGEGNDVECEVLFTFESNETGKNYIVYTINDEGNTKVFASIYDPDGDETALLPIETEEEWQVIQKILDELMEENE